MSPNQETILHDICEFHGLSPIIGVMFKYSNCKFKYYQIKSNLNYVIKNSYNRAVASKKQTPGEGGEYSLTCAI